MRVLVTGACGYIGPVMVAALRAAGYVVDALDVGWFLNQYAEWPAFARLAMFEDIREPLVLPNYDGIVHLAGLSNDPLGNLHPNLTVEINTRGTTRIMAAHPRTRHVFVSSCSVYGANQMATEASPTNPLTAYARSKVLVDDWLDAHPTVNGISLRLGTVYGYSPGHRTDLVVNAMTYAAAQGRDITVDNGASRPIVHVEDVATAILWALGESKRGVVNVVGENTTIPEIAETIASFVGADIRRAPTGSVDQRDYAADGSLLRSQGWQPRHSLEGSIPVLFEKTLGLPIRDYTRIGAIQTMIESGILTPQLTRKGAP